MRKTRGKRAAFVVCFLLLFAALPFGAHADIGPKPSVRVAFPHLGQTPCVATLLSEKSSSGPFRAWDGEEERLIDHTGIDDAAWEALLSYRDADGFYFLQTAWVVRGTGEYELAWTYHPPRRFKILLYFPESETFAASDICERYAFDSYFTARVREGQVTATRSYRWGREIGALAARMALTVLIEMGVALLFGFRGRRALLTLFAVNVGTQLALNVALNLIALYHGKLAALVWLFLLEPLVFAAEAALCLLLRRRLSDKPRRAAFYVLYALAANAVSFAAGLGLAALFPALF